MWPSKEALPACLFDVQEVTRAHKGWALDNVILQNQVTKMMKDEVRTEPVEGVYVYGLYLEGAGWDRRYSKLVESRNKILSEIMPVIHIFANNTASSESSHYVCPIYKKPRRTDLTFVATVTLRSSQHSDRWILRGVALLCDIKWFKSLHASGQVLFSFTWQKLFFVRFTKFLTH